MNGFYLVGRVIEEPEVSQTSNGIALCRLKLSVNKTNRNQEENKEVFEIFFSKVLRSSGMRKAR